MSERTQAEVMKGMDFIQALAHWETVARGAKVAALNAASAYNRALVGSTAKSAEARKAEAELAAEAQQAAADQAEIAATAAFTMLRQIQWSSSTVNAQQRRNDAPLRPAQNIEGIDLQIDWSPTPTQEASEDDGW